MIEQSLSMITVFPGSSLAMAVSGIATDQQEIPE
jgi:hypothetical protein